jgi:phospholipase C
MEAQTPKPNPIKTIVILVQENRSFDHMLGWMKSLNPEIEGVTGLESNPISTTDPNSTRIQFSNKSPYIVESDPPHSFQAIYEQIFGAPISDPPVDYQVPTMEGFVQVTNNDEKQREAVMNGYEPDSLPVLKELVNRFGVCDRWFASLPSSTQPNRLYVHSATSDGMMSNETKRLILGFPQKTIFESLEESGFTFGIYHQYFPTTLFYRNLRRLKYIDNFHQFDLSFKRHCEEGKLPNYVVIEQRYFQTKLLPGNDDHPPHDISEGQNFIKNVYEALRSSPQWNEILFVIIYDEHGGFYDHVPTPVTGVPNPDDKVGPEPYNFKFDRLGVRVPAILISPWIEPGTVLHGPTGPFPTSEFEHSSIPATVKKIFHLKNFLTKRDAWAGTFEGIINRTTPRTDCPVTLPDAIKMREEEEKEEAKLSEFQGELVQLAASLNGDHKKDIFPNKLIENMTVTEAVIYVEGAYKKFCSDCHKARDGGAGELHIVCDHDQDEKTTPNAIPPQKPVSKSFASKVFSCLVCDNH